MILSKNLFTYGGMFQNRLHTQRSQSYMGQPIWAEKKENDRDGHFLISREEQVQKEVHTFPLSSNSQVLPLQIDVQGTRSPEPKSPSFEERENNVIFFKGEYNHEKIQTSKRKKDHI